MIYHKNQNNLNFTFNDNSNIYGAVYQYQLVPVTVQHQGDIDIEIEGTGQPSKNITSSFNGVFICDAETFAKLDAGVEYGTAETVQLTGVHTTLGGQYPIVVTNSKVNYHTNSINGTILNTDYGNRNEDGTFS